jgi:hypothetical protein
VVVTDVNGQAKTYLTVAEGENTVTSIVNPDISDTITVIGVVPTTGSIYGTVTDKITGNPIKFAFVIAINAETKEKYKDFTDKNGDYEIPDLPAGTYLVLCIAKGYKAGIKKVEVPPGEADFELIPKLE